MINIVEGLIYVVVFLIMGALVLLAIKLYIWLWNKLNV